MSLHSAPAFCRRTKLPQGDDWLYEIKLDGYRALLMKDGDRIQIWSRNDKDLTRMYPGSPPPLRSFRRTKWYSMAGSWRLMQKGDHRFKPCGTAGASPTHRIVF